MPKYKELQVNVKVSPEAILGGLLGGAVSVQAEQVTQTEIEQKQAE